VQIRNVILDWSGTLVNDLPPVWRTTNFVFESFGLPPLTLEQFRREFCLPISRFYADRLPQVPMRRLEEVFIGYYAQVRHEISPLPHAESFLRFCAERAMPVFVASSADEETYSLQMNRFGLAGYVRRPYLAISDKTEQIHQILADNALAPGETMFVGDMEHDIAAGKAGGVRTCANMCGLDRIQSSGETPRHAAGLGVRAPRRTATEALWIKSQSKTWNWTRTSASPPKNAPAHRKS
jgi:phosphoglycolate phosphatase